MMTTMTALIYACGDSVGDELRPADRWMFQLGDVWAAVPAGESEDGWFADADPEGLPWPRVYPIGRVPPFGVLTYRRADGTDVVEQPVGEFRR